MTKQEAREHLLQEAICWQHNARVEYESARFQREQWLNGCAANLASYKHHMEMARTFQYQSMIILTALI